MKILKCKRCGYCWQYKGKKKYWCSCPNCKTSVQIRKIPNKIWVLDTDDPKKIRRFMKKLKKNVNRIKK